MPNFLSNWLRNRRTMKALARLSDRELADVGIERDLIKTTVATAARWSKSEEGSALAMAPSFGRQQALGVQLATR